MDFSRQQERALQLVTDWLESDRQVFKLFGYAGTGKTTLAQHIGADYYAAYTGKAAYVLRTKGCPTATTIHSLIYIPKSKSAARLKELEDQLEKDPNNAELRARVVAERRNVKAPAFSLNLDSPLRTCRLLVIDECSMVGEQMGRDLLGFGCKVLVLGDPAQLPPVGDGGYFTEGEPDVLLTEVHRQARGNPILDLATVIREEGELPNSHPCIHSERITEEMAMGVDQLIVGRNDTRRATNARVRAVLGRTTALPQEGDRVVCLRNNHNLGLLNGALYDVTGVEHWEDEMFLELNEDLVVPAHKEHFLGEEVDYWTWNDAEHFDFGYTLTCHKAQGSQWNKVGIKDESAVFRQHAARWLYTAVTRAAEELWVATA